ncbi:hypothetical protein JOB18_029234 [Solea senegalensis]|uniref:Uncharacterized protein n=1 Tax=Solea senegalensis TaxID=28829 RepID=A0AAV6REY8_SOLSE|nr:hypothetical protein JOB18_029234 [Solea senegalensis]
MSSYAIMNENWMMASWVMVQSETEKSLKLMYQGTAVRHSESLTFNTESVSTGMPGRRQSPSLPRPQLENICGSRTDYNSNIVAIMEQSFAFFPGRKPVNLCRGPWGHHLQEPSDAPKLLKGDPSLQDTSAPLREDAVRENALAVVRVRAGDASDETDVVGQ